MEYVHNREYDEIYFHLGYDAVPFGNWFQTFRTMEQSHLHETNTLSQKVRKHLSSDRVSYPGRKKISTTSVRKSRDMIITLVNKDFVP